MRTYRMDKFGNEVLVNAGNKSGFETDEMTGQRIWASDNGFSRYTKPRGTEYRTYKEDREFGNKEMREDRKIMNFAWMLMDAGKKPDPSVSLEEWVAKEMENL